MHTIDSFDPSIDHPYPTRAARSKFPSLKYPPFLETCINFDNFFALSPFRLVEGKSTTNCATKIIFAIINVLSLVENIIVFKQVQDGLNQVKKNYSIDYMLIGYRIFSIYLQLRYFQTVWMKQADFEKLIDKLKSTKILKEAAPKWHRFLAVGIRMISIFASAFFTLELYNFFDSPWSFKAVVKNQSQGIMSALKFLPFLEEAKTLNETSTNATDLISTAVEHLQLKDKIIGGSGTLLLFINEVTNSSPYDIFLSATITLWIYVESLKLDHLQNIWDPLLLKEKSLKLLQQKKEISEISECINEILNWFLPTLVMNVAILTFVAMHLYLRGLWGIVIFLALKIFKSSIAFVIATRIANQVNKIDCWVISDEAQQILNFDATQLQIKSMEMSLKPIGIGTSYFFINGQFIGSFFGIIVTYFFVLGEAINDD